MKHKITQVNKICDICDGHSFLSSCCNNLVDNNRCLECGKFCKTQYCCEGIHTVKIGDLVEIFVCKYSPEYIRNLFININEPKSIFGKIIEFKDESTAVIKFKYYKDNVEIKVDDLTIEY